MPRALASSKSPPQIAPAEVQTFSEEGDRARLSPVALRAYRNLTKQWNLANTEAAALLGVSGSTWDRVKRGQSVELSQDQLTRISALVGLFKGLNLLFADAMANRWPGLRNKGPLFGQRTPIQAMIEGGIPLMLDVRRYIDAVRGGL
ncbi:hypothetical protein BH10PSE7_BH10PSE7_20030 [soil metagenome]